MRRPLIAAVSAAIIVTAAWSQAKADNLLIDEYLVACGIGCLKFVPLAQITTSRVIAAANANKSPGGFENTILTYIEELSGRPQFLIPQFSFGKCTPNNFAKTCF